MPVTTTLTPWAAHDTQLILSCALGLPLVIIFISVLEFAPFLSILVGTFAAGFAAGLPPEAVASAFSKGPGALFGDVAGFRMVREYFGLQLKQTVLVWSVLQTIVPVVGLALTLVLWRVR